MTTLSQPAVPVTLRAGVGTPKPLLSRLGDLPKMPLEGPLVDPYGRTHTDLRISVTDRCNLRCTYCMPEDGIEFLPTSELLTVDEIARVVVVAKAVGVTSVRVTGGEPLVRRGIVEIVSALGEIGIDDLSMTTNGTALRRHARALKAAGLDRVNISCDSLRPEVFGAIRRRGNLDVVLDAMDAAEEAGLTPVKINVVLVPGENDDELIGFAELARTTGRVVRFIEFMPLDGAGRWRRDLVVPGEQVVATIDAVYPLVPISDPSDSAPASRFAFADGRGEIGIIASVTQPFCGTCNRLRLMADGAVRNCLFSDDELSLRTVLRSRGSDDELETLLRSAVWGKLPGHGINEPGFLQPARTMSRIGG